MSHYKHDYLQHTKFILAGQLGLEEGDITPEKSLLELGADSLDAVELILTFEEEYDIEISEEDAEKCKTVADIVNALAERFASNPGVE